MKKIIPMDRGRVLRRFLLPAVGLVLLFALGVWVATTGRIGWKGARTVSERKPSGPSLILLGLHRRVPSDSSGRIGWKEDYCRGGDFAPPPPICVQMVMTPSPLSPGDTAVVVVGARPFEADLARAEVDFVFPDPKRRGAELVEGAAKDTVSLKLGIWQEFRYKLVVTGPAVSFQVVVQALEARWKDGSLVTDPARIRGRAGDDLVLFERDNHYYLRGMEPRIDPNADLQHDLGLPDSGYWYSVAFHLRDDLLRYGPARRMTYDQAKAFLIGRAKRMSREERVELPKAYETILTHRLLWKEGGLPDPFSVGTNPHPTPEDKALALESEVKAVAHSVQLAVEDFKMTPGKEGIKPATVAELKGVLPKAVSDKRNPYDPKETYSLKGGALVDGQPRQPGQVGYIFKGQEQPYQIQGLGAKRNVIVSLQESD